MKKILLTLSIASVLFAGCKKETSELKDKGQISFSLVSEGEFTPASDETKADDSNPDVVDINEFTVHVVNKTSSEEVYSWDRLADVPSVIAMNPSSYTILAASPGTKDVAWNQPIYKGSQDFVVEAGKVVNIDLVCKLKNMKVTVKCTDNFIEELNSEFTIKVSTEYGYLEYTKAIIDQGTSMAGYFSVSPLTVEIKGVRKLDGSIVSHFFTVPNVAERDHHVFTVDAKETGDVEIGTGETLGITVDYEVNQKDVEIQVGDLIENPVEEDDDNDNTGAPVASRVSIVAGSQQAVSLGSISVTYSLPIALAENPGITLGDVPVTPSVNGKVLTVSFGTLAYGSRYTLNVPQGAILNSVDQTPAAAYSVSFTTEEEAVEIPIYITATGGINSPAVYTYQQPGVTFVINISAEKGISSFPVEVESEGLKDMINDVADGAFDETVDLADMSYAEEEFWGGMFGTTSAQIKGSTTVTFSIGGFISMMPQGTHPIKMTIIDNDGNQKTATITFQIN